MLLSSIALFLLLVAILFAGSLPLLAMAQQTGVATAPSLLTPQENATTTDDDGGGTPSPPSTPPGAIKLNVRVVEGDVVNISPGAYGSAVASCDPRETLTGGGFVSSGVRIIDSFPSDETNEMTWEVYANNPLPTTTTGQLWAYALCAEPITLSSPLPSTNATAPTNGTGGGGTTSTPSMPSTPSSPPPTTSQDTIAPTLTVPNELQLVANNSTGAIGIYNAMATDNVDGEAVLESGIIRQDNVGGNITIACDPPSGSTFGIGATTVQCNAYDAAGNQGTALFTVTVNRGDDFKPLIEEQPLIEEEGAAPPAVEEQPPGDEEQAPPAAEEAPAEEAPVEEEQPSAEEEEEQPPAAEGDEGAA
jgi:hypothetical protein